MMMKEFLNTGILVHHRCGVLGRLAENGKNGALGWVHYGVVGSLHSAAERRHKIKHSRNLAIAEHLLYSRKNLREDYAGVAARAKKCAVSKFVGYIGYGSLLK